MEDKRTAFAIFLIIMVIMVYSELFLAPYTRPPVTQPTSSQQAQTGTSQTINSNSAVGNQAASPIQTDGSSNENSQISATQLTASAALTPPTIGEIETYPTTKVESDHVSISITHLGARIKSFKLKKYLDHLGNPSPKDLVIPSDIAPLPLGVSAAGLDDSHTEYSLAGHENATNESSTFSIPKEGDLTLTFKGTLPNGQEITKLFRFSPASYLFDVEVKATPLPDNSSYYLNWTRFVSELALEDRLNILQFTVLDQAEKIQNFPLKGFEKDTPKIMPITWVGLSDKYFVTSLIPTTQGAEGVLFHASNGIFTESIRGDANSVTAHVLAAPKDYEILKGLGHQLERSIDLGFFAFVSYPLLILIKLLESFLGNYGLAIVAVTLLLKGLFFPLTRASLQSMQAMQELQPEIKALRERVKDPTQLNQEMMALYKKRGVNPMGGCLPMIIQIPVFFGLYSALLHSIELRHAPFALWIKDLSSPEKFDIAGVNLPVMILLMGAAMFLQQYKNPSQASVDPTQRKMMLFMPLIFTGMFLVFPFPAGLALYMLVNTTISLVQQMYLKSDKSAKPFRATALASIAIFGFAYILTLLG